MKTIKPLGTCPECGSNTVVERQPIFNSLGKTIRVERCDGLVEVSPNKPLDACKWEQNLDDYYDTNNISSVSGIGIQKP